VTHVPVTGTDDTGFVSVLVVARRDEVAAALVTAAERRGLVARRATVQQVLDDPPGAETAFRIPFSLALRLAALGKAPRLQCPGPRWLPNLPRWASGREIRLVTLAEIAAGRTEAGQWAFPARVKLPELKHPGFPARRWASAQAVLTAAAAAGMPSATLLQYSVGELDLHSEYRVFVAHGRALTAAPYVVAGEEYSPELVESPAAATTAALQFAQSVLDDLGPERCPDGFALDIARCDDGRFVVLEANTSWAAAPYGCLPDAVLTAVLAANGGPGAARWPLSAGSGQPWPVGPRS
jgi:hypothetical protein